MEQRELKRRSQELRKNMIREERHLWYAFLKTYPVQFKRQYSVGIYIADFYCHRAKLIVELDGSQHYEPENVQRDMERTAYLEQQGFLVLRFSNRDIWERFRSVCEAIDIAVKERTRD